MALSMTDMAAELAALKAAVRGLIGHAKGGRVKARIEEADLPDITQKAEVKAKAEAILADLLKD